MEKMREEFEAWAANDGYELDVSDDERFTYAFHETECAWYGWQASRATLCVEFPSKTYSHYLELDIMIARHVESALDAAGIRYT